jgi:D-3-phosphoglycerate dehydrogenase
MADRPATARRVLVAEPIDAEAEAWLAQRHDLVHPRDGTPEGLIDAARPCEGLIVRTTPVGAPLLEAAERLRVIAKSGSGTDNIDVVGATEKGIVVANSPGANAVSVAEFALTLIMLVLRPVVAAADWLGSGAAEGSLVVATERAGLIGRELASQTIGVVGWGDIGRRVGRACHGLGASVVAYDPAKSVAEMESDGVRAADSLDELLAESDVVTVHVPLAAATIGLIGHRELARLRPHAALVNVSRGGVVDEGALADALSGGRLRCVATDVFGEEPPPADHPLLRLPNALCTPHMGGTTVDALRRMGWTAVRAVDDVLSNRRPAHVVNDEAAHSQGLT